MALKFITIATSEPVVDFLHKKISLSLREDKQVLLLVPGGSAIQIVIDLAQKLSKETVPLGKLVLTLTDERYGPVGHADSNWKQLNDSGLKLPGVTLHSVLNDKSMADTERDFEMFLNNQINEADYTIGFFGIGPDGHTSGILPNSSAVHASHLVHAYDGGTYQRITTTPAAISKLDEAVVYAVGESKWPVLRQLETKKSIDEQPAQALKRIPKVTIFSDKP
jgi:6-phosphogluconolactonase/glucosamine-6-phosphate isomerase/deaminase